MYRGAGGAYQVEIMQEQRSHDVISKAVKEALELGLRRTGEEWGIGQAR